MSEETPEQPQTEAPSASSEINTGEWLRESWELYKGNIGLLIGASIAAGFTTAITIGILGGAMSVGLFLIVARLLDGSEPKPKVTDVYKGLSSVLPALLFVIGIFAINMIASVVLSSIPGIGGILSTIGSLAIGTLLMFGIPLIAFQGLDPIPAAKKSVDTVMKDFMGYFVFNVVASVVGFCGVILFGIGVIFTMPVYFVALVIAYRKTFGA